MVRVQASPTTIRQLLVATAISMTILPSLAVAQQNGADQIRRTYGMTPDVEASPYRTPARDQNGVRLIINGRPVDLGGPRPAGPARLADPNSSAGQLSPSTRSGRLPSSTLGNSTAIGNIVSINNVRNSTINVTQINNGRVTAAAAPR